MKAGVFAPEHRAGLAAHPAPFRPASLHMEIVWFILIGLVAGWLAGLIMKGGGYGPIGDIIVGVLGSLLGGWLFGQFGVSLGGGLGANLVVATVGALVLILTLRVVKRL